MDGLSKSGKLIVDCLCSCKANGAELDPLLFIEGARVLLSLVFSVWDFMAYAQVTSGISASVGGVGSIEILVGHMEYSSSLTMWPIRG